MEAYTVARILHNCVQFGPAAYLRIARRALGPRPRADLASTRIYTCVIAGTVPTHRRADRRRVSFGNVSVVTPNTYLVRLASQRIDRN